MIRKSLYLYPVAPSSNSLHNCNAMSGKVLRLTLTQSTNIIWVPLVLTVLISLWVFHLMGFYHGIYHITVRYFKYLQRPLACVFLWLHTYISFLLQLLLSLSDHTSLLYCHFKKIIWLESYGAGALETVFFFCTEQNPFEIHLDC